MQRLIWCFIVKSFWSMTRSMRMSMRGGNVLVSGKVNHKISES